MKRSALVYVMAGFLTGVIYISACGGGSNSVAASIGNAIDVIFNNTSSGLSATNAQAAIDELATKVNDLEKGNKIGADLASDLVGAWTGTYCNGADCQDISITLNSDGSLSCNAGGGDAFGGTCDDPAASWSVLTRVLKLSFDAGAQVRFLNTTYASSTILEMSDGTQHLYSLTKAE